MMPFKDLDLAESHLDCALIVYSPSSSALAHALVSCWESSKQPQVIALDGPAIPQSLQSDAIPGWVLLITTEDADPAVLEFNRWLVARNVRTLIILDRIVSLWGLWRDDARVSPCLACLFSQREFIPRHPTTSSSSTLDRARSLFRWIERRMKMAIGEEHYCFLHPVLAGDHARTSQVLQDPLCPVCSKHAVRPNHVFFTANT